MPGRWTSSPARPFSAGWTTGRPAGQAQPTRTSLSTRRQRWTPARRASTGSRPPSAGWTPPWSGSGSTANSKKPSLTGPTRSGRALPGQVIHHGSQQRRRCLQPLVVAGLVRQVREQVVRPGAADRCQPWSRAAPPGRRSGGSLLDVAVALVTGGFLGVAGAGGLGDALVGRGG